MSKKSEVDKLIEDQKKPPMLEVKSTPEIKLRDAMGRGGLILDLREVFGFKPNRIVIQKVFGRNNVIVVSAVLPREVLLKEEEDAKKAKPVVKGSKKLSN